MSKFKVGELAWYIHQNNNTDEIQIRCDEIHVINQIDTEVYFNTLFEDGTTYLHSAHTSNVFKTSEELLKNIKQQIKNKTPTEKFEDAPEGITMGRFFLHKNKIKKL